MWISLCSFTLLLLTISSCAQPPIIDLVDQEGPEEDDQLHSGSVQMTQGQFFDLMQQLYDTSLNEHNFMLRGKRSLRDLFYGRRLLAVPWGGQTEESLLRGKKKELKHLPWQMDLNSPMLRG